jgi:hypothetical protein
MVPLSAVLMGSVADTDKAGMMHMLNMNFHQQNSAGPSRAMRYSGFLCADIYGRSGARSFDRPGTGRARPRGGEDVAQGLL